MMNISQYVDPDLIIADLRADSKENAISILIDRVFEVHSASTGGVSKEKAYKEVIEREKMQTTGLGQKMAFPHARIEGWNEFVIALGYSKTGIEFNSLDKAPVHFVCLMISPMDNPYIILKAMSSMIRFLQGKDDIGVLFEEKNAYDIASVFGTYKLDATRMILARDLMRPLKTIVHLDDSIEDVIKVMHLKHIDVLPVVDNDRKLKGQISCLDIFQREIPEFFSQLHTVSFVRNIDPFEKYFKFKKQLKVIDFLKQDCVTINEDTTLVEIIFLLTVKRYPRLFVTRDGNLVGIVDRFSILDRILFF